MQFQFTPEQTMYGQQIQRQLEWQEYQRVYNQVKVQNDFNILMDTLEHREKPKIEQNNNKTTFKFKPDAKSWADQVEEADKDPSKGLVAPRTPPQKRKVGSWANIVKC